MECIIIFVKASSAIINIITVIAHIITIIVISILIIIIIITPIIKPNVNTIAVFINVALNLVFDLKEWRLVK